MSFKTRLEKGFPVFSRMLSRTTPILRKSVVSGGAAGAIAVTDIKAGDQLVSVMHFTAGALTADLTSEFVANTNVGQIVIDDGEISNAGGTATTGDELMVEWLAWAE